MMRWNHGYNCLSQPHVSPEGGGATNLYEARVSCCFILYVFFVKKLKMSFGLNNINKQTIMNYNEVPETKVKKLKL
jgi:hypothetical protein